MDHPAHGSVIQVGVLGASAAERAPIGRVLHERLGPLPMHHDIDWR